MLLVSDLWPIVFRLATSKNWPPCNEADTIAFLEYANREGLLSLLMADDQLPEIVTASKPRFRVLDALRCRHGELTSAAAKEFRRAIGDSVFIFFKGADYRHHLYPSPALRPVADIDVLVQADDLKEILGRLADAGYFPKYLGDGAQFAPSYHEVTVEVRNVGIDIHRRYRQPYREAIDYEGLLRRRIPFERDGVCGYRLSPTDAILSHAYAGLTADEFSQPLIRYVDFYLLLQRYESHLEECVSRAKEWSIERSLFGALHVTTKLFPNLPTTAMTSAMSMLLKPSIRHLLVNQVLPDPANERSGHQTGRCRQLWRKFLLIDQTWRTIAFAMYHIYETVVGHIFHLLNRCQSKRFPRSLHR